MAGLDHGALLASGYNSIPDVVDQEINRSLGRAQVDQTQAQTSLLKQKLAEGLAGAAHEQQYDSDVRMALESGDPRALSQLIAKYPEQKDALKASWDQMDSLKQRSELRQAAGIWSALNAGNTDAAIRQLEQRITSDREAGEDTADDEEQLALLRSGDPKAINSVKGRLGLFMASVVPDKFASVVEQLGTGADRDYTLSPGQQRRSGATGEIIAAAPFAPRPVTVGEGDTVIEYAPGTGTGNLTVDVALPAIVEQESGGNYAAVNKETGALGAYQVMPATGQSLAKRLGLPWRPELMASATPEGRAYQDSIGRAAVEEAIANSGGDPATMAAYYHGGSDRSKWGPKTQQYAREVSARLGAGGSRVIARGPDKAPKPQPVRMTPEEVAAEGLDPDLIYYRGVDGVPTLVPGQDTRTRLGRAIPDSTAKRVESNVEVREGLARAVASFRPDYAGNPFTGGLENILQGVFRTGTPGQRDWWANFRSLDNLIRNDLFGSALTEHEKKAYEGTTISERMDPTEVRLNLQRRLEIVRKALARQQNFLKKNGYAEEAVDALFGGDALNEGGVVSVRSVQEANALPPGTLYRAPDGKVRKR